MNRHYISSMIQPQCNKQRVEKKLQRTNAGNRAGTIQGVLDSTRAQQNSLGIKGKREKISHHCIFQSVNSAFYRLHQPLNCPRPGQFLRQAAPWCKLQNLYGPPDNCTDNSGHLYHYRQINMHEQKLVALASGPLRPSRSVRAFPFIPFFPSFIPSFGRTEELHPRDSEHPRSPEGLAVPPDVLLCFALLPPL